MIDPHRVLRFDAEQLRRLAALQVTTEQVRELELVLPRCRSMLRDAPRLDDVRAELNRIRKALACAAAEIQRFDVEPLVAISDARTLIELHGGMNGQALERAECVLRPVVHAVDRALRRLPATQTRTSRAAWGPVQLIAEALARGWTSAYPFPHSPSEGKKRPFRRVVGVCYDAILGVSNSDPLRAIRGYLGWKRSQRA